jgi:hypothetical protein
LALGGQWETEEAEVWPPESTVEPLTETQLRYCTLSLQAAGTDGTPLQAACQATSPLSKLSGTVRQRSPGPKGGIVYGW